MFSVALLVGSPLAFLFAFLAVYRLPRLWFLPVLAVIEALASQWALGATTRAPLPPHSFLAALAASGVHVTIAYLLIRVGRRQYRPVHQRADRGGEHLRVEDKVLGELWAIEFPPASRATAGAEADWPRGAPTSRSGRGARAPAARPRHQAR